MVYKGDKLQFKYDSDTKLKSLRISRKFHKTFAFFKEESILAGVLSFLIASTLLLSTIIPPFQSSDEFEHTKKAYLATTRNIILKPLGTGSTEGTLDAGFLQYMKQYEQYPFSPLYISRIFYITFNIALSRHYIGQLSNIMFAANSIGSKISSLRYEKP